LHITSEAAQALLKSEIYEILCKLEAEEMRAELDAFNEAKGSSPRQALAAELERAERLFGGTRPAQPQEQDAKAATEAARQRARRTFG